MPSESKRPRSNGATGWMVGEENKGLAAMFIMMNAARLGVGIQGLAQAEAAICYGRMGVSTQAYGALNQWLIQLINIATGNLDRPGGSMFTLPAVDQVASISPGGFGRHHRRSHRRNRPTRRPMRPRSVRS